MNVKGAGATPAAIVADTVAKVNATGFHLEPATMQALADQVGEKSLYGRTGGAATLAVGMATVFSKVTHGKWLDLWYHFAIMFEALFILTTLDAGTRVGRYLLQDFLGHLWKPLGDVRSIPAGVLASGLIVAGWGWFLIQGVRDPLGGINSLWPLFGIANQLLASIALVLAATVLLKMSLQPSSASPPARSRAIFLVVLIPMAWLLSVTGTAGWQKIFDKSPRIGFLSAADGLDEKRAGLAAAIDKAQTDAERALARKALATNRTLAFNNRLDAAVTGTFLTFVAAIVASGAWEWIQLARGVRKPDLNEEPAMWLPEERFGTAPKWGGAASLAALALGLARNWSGQDAIDARAGASSQLAGCGTLPRLLIDVPEVRNELERERRKEAYLQITRDRAASPRCC
jgi:carbon starvation protein